jgi:hypothetical protein
MVLPYITTRKERGPAEWLSEVEITGKKRLIHLVLAPLMHDEYFGSSFENALVFPKMVSRNRIINQEDLNYYSQLNSCKVISSSR